MGRAIATATLSQSSLCLDEHSGPFMRTAFGISSVGRVGARVTIPVNSLLLRRPISSRFVVISVSNEYTEAFQNFGLGKARDCVFFPVFVPVPLALSSIWLRGEPIPRYIKGPTARLPLPTSAVSRNVRTCSGSWWSDAGHSLESAQSLGKQQRSPLAKCGNDASRRRTSELFEPRARCFHPGRTARPATRTISSNRCR